MFPAMYLVVLYAHSWVRWLVLACGVTIAGYAVNARVGGKSWSARASSLSRLWVGVTDVQVALGLVLFFTEGSTAHAARHDVSLAMREPTLRFFGCLHPLAMVLAFIGTHATWIAVRRTNDASTRYRRLAIGAISVVALILTAVPWTFLSYGRPLLRTETAPRDRGLLASVS